MSLLCVCHCECVSVVANILVVAFAVLTLNTKHLQQDQTQYSHMVTGACHCPHFWDGIRSKEH